ncbi:hypothetical protein [Maritimibacter sp. DP1N21-5]|uniref:hypothetical protein n=1 Tax=Maritimibacter sp. DP1N21-5 TaxID=2836867 RepID=UPI001C44D2F9|nr:hypothetical protein [Maritimibacter sp. DP1N21-5]MBV7408798.1 hypothetical protein [Maritimibacter sp. DP1N21-5]
MKVSDIDIRELRHEARFGRFLGSVSMLIDRPGQAPRRVVFICQAHRAEDAPSSLITYDLVTHAIDQARAMPGFRHGEEQIDMDVGARVSTVPIRAA